MGGLPLEAQVRRFWFSQQNLTAHIFTVSGDLFHHIRDVCRFEIGDQFELIAGGKAHTVKVLKVLKREIEVERISERDLPSALRPHIHLAVSLPKLPKMDWIVEKSVELGVKALYPFTSEFSAIRSPKELSGAKRERWGRLGLMAAQQSGRGDTMEILPPQTFADLLQSFNRRNPALGLMAYEGLKPNPLKSILRGIGTSPEEIWLFIGSEGGFSTAEADLGQGLGLKLISLGEQILRVETACLALVSVIKYEFQGVSNGPDG